MYFDKDKPTLLLNSHHDTVRPNQAYTNDPFKAIVRDGSCSDWGVMMLEVVVFPC
jgi:acetylornithine deacetylase/succinyl-diaminopimelate desuccinylase-like protein